jgi:hypothetical protein
MPQDFEDAKARSAKKLYPAAWYKPDTPKRFQDLIAAGARILSNPVLFSTANIMTQQEFMEAARNEDKVSRKAKDLKPKRDRSAAAVAAREDAKERKAMENEGKFVAGLAEATDVSELDHTELTNLIPSVETAYDENKERSKLLKDELDALGGGDLPLSAEQERARLVAEKAAADQRCLDLQRILPAMKKRKEDLAKVQGPNRIRKALHRAAEKANAITERTATAVAGNLVEDGTGPAADEVQVIRDEETGEDEAERVHVVEQQV